MFKLDKSTLQYMKDLSDPKIASSNDIEDINLKREIIKQNLLTLIIGTFVIGTIIILFIFYLPGLFNVFQQIVLYYITGLFTYWRILAIVFVLFLVLVFFSFKKTS